MSQTVLKSYKTGIDSKVSIWGDRRDHFNATNTGYGSWHNIVIEYKKRELEPTVQFLQELMDSEEFEHENSGCKTEFAIRKSL
jgi:DNA-binding transcriptional regulator GbsR (MarR family)